MNALSSDPAVPDPTVPVALRVPAHRVSPRAVSYWRALNALSLLVSGVVLAAAWLGWEDMWGWLKIVGVTVLALEVVGVFVEPWFKFRVHRWEVDDVAVHTRSGWLNLETKVAPLSRVQTVEFAQGALMRLFGVASLTVTTASAAGPITIEGLAADQARELVARLTAITGSDRGDAT